MRQTPSSPPTRELSRRGIGDHRPPAIEARPPSAPPLCRRGPGGTSLWHRARADFPRVLRQDESRRNHLGALNPPGQPPRCSPLRAPRADGAAGEPERSRRGKGRPCPIPNGPSSTRQPCPSRRTGPTHRHGSPTIRDRRADASTRRSAPDCVPASLRDIGDRPRPQRRRPDFEAEAVDEQRRCLREKHVRRIPPRDREDRNPHDEAGGDRHTPPHLRTAAGSRPPTGPTR